MNPEVVVKYYGGSVRQTAEALGFTTQCVYKWLENKRIPYHSQLIIQLHTNGKLKAKKPLKSIADKKP